MIPGLVGIPGPVLSSHTELRQVSTLASKIATADHASNHLASMKIYQDISSLTYPDHSSRSQHYCQLPRIDHGVFPVCLRGNHRDSLGWCTTLPYEFQSLDALRATMDYFQLYSWWVKRPSLSVDNPP